MSVKILLRIELICNIGNLKAMISAPYGKLPAHYKSWKIWRNKEEIQFLHVLPCRCGFIRSNNRTCECSKEKDIAGIYRDRNRRHFYEEGYSIYLDASNFDFEEYEQNRKPYIEAIEKLKSHAYVEMEYSNEAQQLLSQAKHRFAEMDVTKMHKIAEAIANIDLAQKANSSLFSHEIEKRHLLEALSYRPR